MRLGKFLTIAAAIIVIAGVLAFVLVQIEQVEGNYERNIHYSVTKTLLNYDYSCGQQVYSLYLVLKNSGNKLVDDLSVGVSNPLCVGSVPIISPELVPSQQLKFYVYTAAQNGTITVSGNNTLLLIRF